MVNKTLFAGKSTVNSYDFSGYSHRFLYVFSTFKKGVELAAEGTLKRRCTASSGSSNCLVQVKGNPCHNRVYNP